MDGQAGDGKRRVKGTETVDVVNHAQKDRRRKRSMRGETLEVICDGDTGRGSGVKPSQTAVTKRDLIVVLDELHQHA